MSGNHAFKLFPIIIPIDIFDPARMKLQPINVTAILRR